VLKDIARRAFTAVRPITQLEAVTLMEALNHHERTKLSTESAACDNEAEYLMATPVHDGPQQQHIQGT
jgi:hypothetical protein